MAKIEVIEQIKNFYSTLTRNQKIIIGSAIGLALLGIIFLMAGTSSTSVTKAPLFTSLESSDASKIIEKLKEQNIDYEISDNGETILIDKSLIHETRLTLANEGLPESGVIGYEIFDRTNLGMSEFVQKVNYRRALEGELARTIGSIDEVRKVRVHLVIPEKTLFKKDQKEPTASVTLHFKSGRSLGRISVEGIQNLVANSIEGLQPSAVSIIDQRGKILSPPTLDESTIGGLTNKQHEEKRRLENYMTDKVQSLLDGVLGEGNSEVRIDTDLDFNQETITQTTYDPESVTRSEQIKSETVNISDSVTYPVDYTSMSQESDIGDVDINSSVEEVITEAGATKTKETSNSIINYEISQKVNSIVKEVGEIKRLSVSVLVNHKETLIEKENGVRSHEFQPRTPEEILILTNIVKNAVGFDSTRNDQVVVSNYLFDTRVKELDPYEFFEAPWYKKPENIRIFALVIAMLLTIYLIYRILQSKQVKERFRIAMELPEHIEEEKMEEIEEEEDIEDSLEDLDIDEDDLLLLPAELPEQLLLEGEQTGLDIGEEDDADAPGGVDRDALAERARAQLDDAEPMELSEEAFMKLEIREKVNDFVDEQPTEAVRLVRLFIQQDIEKGLY